ncbi:MAG: hypothetical protein HYS27_21800 [Deltaproteobacteria bacterium]|nr:hypothetical protein [Deltaproteobacteria bacterium]
MTRLCSLALLFAVSGCQCIDDINLGNIPDAGEEIHDAGPEPPKFPLKAGDQLEYPALGGRTATCPGGGTTGDCDRALTATFIVRGTELDESAHWRITADVVYQGSAEMIEVAAIAPLVLDNGAPFDAVTVATPSSASGAVFLTDAAPTDELDPLGFPFFQFESGDAHVFETSGAAFCARFGELDPSVNCEFQAGDQKMEAYYKDDAAGGGGSMLHHLRAEYHNMGFVCGWDEGLIPFVDDATTPRDQTSFGPADTPALAAIFASPVRLLRDGVTYACSCFSQQCRAGNGAEATCLTTDPDAEPGPCE